MNTRFSALVLAIATIANDPARGMDLAVEVKFHPGWRHAGETGEIHMSGIRMSLDEGWKTYWRVPGEGGIPPHLEIESSRNLKRANVLFPSPKVFEQYGMTIIGYENEVLFPVEVHPENNDAPIEFEGNFFAGICKEVCIPVSYDFSVSLTPPGIVDPAIQSAMESIPQGWVESGMKTVECGFEFSEAGLFATARIPLPNTLGPDHVIFEYADEWVRFGSANVGRPNSNILEAKSEMFLGSNGNLELDASKLRITVLNPKEAIEINGCGPS
ncbi:MAG: protein-disulfide reductase DsbD family protein [Albidovulum sp.]|nr:protein-disulfide reductase DsbD family protein [Albidovulum sp.]